MFIIELILSSYLLMFLLAILLGSMYWSIDKRYNTDLFGIGGTVVLCIIGIMLWFTPLKQLIVDFDPVSISKLCLYYVIIGCVVAVVEWVINVRRMKAKFVSNLENQKLNNPMTDKLAEYLSKKVGNFSWKDDPLVSLYHRYKAVTLNNYHLVEYSTDLSTQDYEAQLKGAIDKYMPPKYNNHKAEIISSGVFWWLIVIEWASFKIVKFVFTLIFNLSGKFFNALSSLVYGKPV